MSTSLPMKVFPLAQENVELVTRQVGLEIREHLAKVIREMREKVLGLDFKGVKVIDFSCADEVIAKLVARVQSKELGDKFVVLLNLSESNKDNIDAALKIAKKNVLVRVGGQGWSVLGEVKDNVLDVLEILMKEKEITTRELRRDLQVKINVLSNKMAILYADCLIYREKKPEPEPGGGRQFLYKALF